MNTNPMRDASRRTVWLVAVVLALVVSLAVSAGGALLAGPDADPAPVAVAAEKEQAAAGADEGEEKAAEEGEGAAEEGEEEGEEEGGLAVEGIDFRPNRIKLHVKNAGEEQ